MTSPAADFDRDAQLSALFDAHYAGLCRIAALLLGNRAQAEELVMDAFAATMAGWRRLRDLDAAPAYLRKAVVNRCRTAQTSRGREQRANARSYAATPTQTLPVEPATQVGLAVRSLPPRQRAAVVLSYFADLSEADVAVALGCSRGTVKSQLSKARASLAILLAEEVE